MSDSQLMFTRVRAGMKQKIKRQRYTVPDIIRGISVIAMVIYHTLWDLVYLFDVSIPWFRTEAGVIFQQSICWSFILLSGFCLQMGRKKLRRSIIVIVCSLVLTAVTALVMPDSIIIHGVLSLIGVSMLITIPLEKFFNKIHPSAGMAVSFLLFILSYKVTKGVIGIGNFCLLTLPDFLYANTATAFFGFPHEDFFSADYVPLFPWLFLFFTGYFICSLLKRTDRMKMLSAFSCRPLEFIGRHSLEIYMAHQPIIFGILFLLFS